MNYPSSKVNKNMSHNNKMFSTIKLKKYNLSFHPPGINCLTSKVKITKNIKISQKKLKTKNKNKKSKKFYKTKKKYKKQNTKKSIKTNKTKTKFKIKHKTPKKVTKKVKINKKSIKSTKIIKNIKKKKHQKYSKSTEGRFAKFLICILLQALCHSKVNIQPRGPDHYIMDNTIVMPNLTDKLTLCNNYKDNSLGSTAMAIHGSTHISCPRDGNPTYWQQNIKLQSKKAMNRAMHSLNGNRQVRNVIQIAHWNLGSHNWQNKITELDALLQEATPDMLFVTEANLFESLPDYQRYVEGYQIYIPEAMMRKHGYARIVLLVREGLDVHIHEELMHEDISVIWTNLKCSNRRSWKIGGVYREHQLLLKNKPNPTLAEGAQLSRWRKILAGWKLAARNSPCVLIGDTNIDYLRWQSPDQAHQKLVDLTKEEIETLGFTQVIKNHTRSWRGQADSLVDQCWLNHPEKLISHWNLTRGSSDHNQIGVVLRTKDKISAGQEILKRTWKNFDTDRYKLKVKNIDWSSLYNCKDINTANTIFEDKLGKILNEEAPWKCIQTRRNYRNWVTSEDKQNMTQRDQAREVARLTDNQHDWDHYRKLGNACSKTLKNRKDEFFRNKFQSYCDNNDPGGTFRTVRSILGWTTVSQPRMFLVAGRLIRKPGELANTLQNFYVSKINNLVGALKKSGQDPLRFLDNALRLWEKSENIPTFNVREITLTETIQHISRLGNTKAHGHDGLDGLTLKLAAEDLARPLMFLINLSITTTTFANKWRIAKILQLLKSKDSNKIDPASYRPVAILPTVSKLVERTVQTQLQNHLEEAQLLNHNGHAYRKNLSTATALLQVVDRLYTATDENLISQLLAVDQSSAFDLVSHSILVRKLKRYGCNERTIKWMQSYLHRRTQYVRVGKHDSHMSAINRGVPQGSILGPLLFLVYTNELSTVINDETCNNSAHEDRSKLFGQNCDACGMVVTYADDATYQVASRYRVRNQLKLNINIAKLETFLNDNELSINVSKTSLLECMIKQKKGKTTGSPPHLIVQTTPGIFKRVEDNPEFILLGVNIQQNMNWQNHLEKGKKAILPNIRRLFGAMQQISNQLPRPTKKLLCEGILMSKMMYLISQWGGGGLLTISSWQHRECRTD